MLVNHGSHLAPVKPCYQRIPYPKGTVLHQKCCHRSPFGIQLGLQHSSPCGLVGIGFELQHLRLQQHHLQKLINTLPCLSRDRNHDGITAPLLGDKTILGKLLFHPFGIGVRLIYLVYGNDYGHSGSLGMVYGLNGLWHHPIISSHHQYHYVRHPSPSGPHGGKGMVPRCVYKGDLTLRQLYLVGSNMLGDTTSLPCRHVGLSDVIKQGGLSMIHMAHYGNYWRSGNEVALFLLCFLGNYKLLFLRKHLKPVLLTHHLGHIIGKHLSQSHRNSFRLQNLLYLLLVRLQHKGKVLYGNRLWQLYGTSLQIHSGLQLLSPCLLYINLLSPLLLSPLPPALNRGEERLNNGELLLLFLALLLLKPLYHLLHLPRRKGLLFFLLLFRRLLLRLLGNRFCLLFAGLLGLFRRLLFRDSFFYSYSLLFFRLFLFLLNRLLFSSLLLRLLLLNCSLLSL